MKDITEIYGDLILPRKIGTAKTVGDLIIQGCPRCGRLLFPEGSTGFGSLHCRDHGCIWLWMNTKRERWGYAPYRWKNMVTRETSREWKKWKGGSE